MLTNSKALFTSLAKALKTDCVCDIGSRDGEDALFFHQLLPKAAVFAFEANPINYEMMARNSALKESHIRILPYAITNQRGTATFHITDVDYSNPDENRGTSSLLVHDGLGIKESVQIETHRIDEFLLMNNPTAMRIALWIDVEGVEYFVLEGIRDIKDKVVVVHVETAKTPMRQGQRIYTDVVWLMNRMGFDLCGSNIEEDSNWGDVVFINRKKKVDLGCAFRICQAKAYFRKAVERGNSLVILKTRFPRVYRKLRSIYVKYWA
jgi:FkbM family methyltransferase